MSSILSKTLFLQKIYNPKNENEEVSLNSLAPKVLTKKKDIEKIKPYLDKLKSAINREDINNIAITGSYGSGKSTLLRTFQHLNNGKHYKYLNLSLASFKDKEIKETNKEASSSNDNVKSKKESLDRQLEVSLLQQIFYHVKSSKIPDSRFKRITNVTWIKLTPVILLVSSWFISIVTLFRFKYIESLNPKKWNLIYEFDWVATLSSLVFLVGIGWCFGKTYRLIVNSRINKFSLKGGIELDGSDNSIFNKYLEEILYFFERTDFNVVVIEDLDRFDSIDIFIKLREINTLLNNSQLIQRQINFVYAIKDEMFIDRTERVKFFEYIIPIIPFINPSNANDQLHELISRANLEGTLSQDFAADIVTFIDDIDMRLLINIFEEYKIYKKTLSESLIQDNLFAILVYKNMYPEDFGKLARRKGNLYTLLTDKDRYITGIKSKLDSKIKELDNQIELIENEYNKSIEELKSIYILRIISKLSNFSCFSNNGRKVSINEAIEDSFFNDLMSKNRISYFHHHYNQIISSKSDISFFDIENEVSKNLSYTQRAQLIIDKNNDKIQLLKEEKASLNNEISELENLSIKGIFERIGITDYLNDFSDSYLMRNLLLNGYIDEHFEDYISLFHEVSLTKDDFRFERNVKAGVGLRFDYKLNKIENLIKRIPNKYFLKAEALNYSVMECLLENKVRFNEELSNSFKYLKIDDRKQFEFIIGFIEARPKAMPLFLELLSAEKIGLWNYLHTKSDLPEKEVIKLTKIILEHVSLSHIKKFKNVESLINYVEGIQEPFQFFNSFEKVQTLHALISDLRPKFKQLDLPNEEQDEIFRIIYSQDCYQITDNNIQIIIQGNKQKYDAEKLLTSHYTTILSLDLDHLKEYIKTNIEKYISDVMTFIKDNQREAHDTIYDVLNRGDVSLDSKRTVLNSQSSPLPRIKEIEELEVMQLVISHNHLIPTWDNIFDYYEVIAEGDNTNFDDLLIGYVSIPKNYEELSKKKLNEFERTSDFIEQISSSLLSCHSLSDNAFMKLIEALPHKYELISYENYEVSRLEVLLDKNILSLSPENYESLKTVDIKLSIRLIEGNQPEFMYGFPDLELDTVDWMYFFKYSNVSKQNKVDLISKIDQLVIISNSITTKAVFDILPVDKFIQLDFEILDAMFSQGYSTEKLIQLLNLHFEVLSNDQIQSLIEKLGIKYAKLFRKKHKPDFVNMKYNLELFDKLQTKGLIKRYSLIKEDTRIRVIANY